MADRTFPAFIARDRLRSSPLTFGSSPDFGPDNRIEAPGIAPQHVRIATIAGNERLFRLLIEPGAKVFLNENEVVRQAVVKPGDRVRFGSELTYRVEKSGLRHDRRPEGMSLSLRGVEAIRDGRSIFRGLSLDVDNDEFVGIIGPSGCGKSTLLEILSLGDADFQGAIFFDGAGDFREPAARDRCKEQLGYVPQDDVVYPKLTVQENLRYAARLRFDGAPEARIDEAIEEALQRVSLEDQREKIVRKLSGGQRKRVGIAMELLKRPRLLILDEPTSGLDPATESSIMKQLREIARQGTTVLCTTHMMANVEDFDKIVAFKHGGVRTFRRQGARSAIAQLKGDRSFADLYEDLAAAAVDSATKKETLFAPEEDETFRPVSRFLKLAWRAPDRYLGKDLRRIKDVFERCAKNFARDPMSVAMTLGQPLVLGALAVLSQYDELDLRPLLFFCIVIAVWLGMNNSVRSLVSERRHYVRENLAGLTMNQYLLGKAFFYAGIGLLQILLLLLVLQGLLPSLCLEGLYESDLPKVMPLTFPLVLFACYFASLGLGLLVSAVAPTENAALTLLPLLIMPQILLSMIAAGNYGDTTAPEESRRLRPVIERAAPKPEVSGEIPHRDLPRDGFEMLSMLCFSRPALFLVEAGISDRPERLRGESLHLAVLTLLAWSGLWFVFYHRQEGWRKTRG